MGKKEKWVEETISLSEAISKVEAPESLNDLHLRKFSTLKIRPIMIQPLSKWAIAASIILLIGINSITIMYYSTDKSSETASSNVVYTEYFSYINQ